MPNTLVKVGSKPVAYKPHTDTIGNVYCAMQLSTTFDPNQSQHQKNVQHFSDPCTYSAASLESKFLNSPSSCYPSPTLPSIFDIPPTISTSTITMSTNSPHGAMGPPVQPASSMAAKKINISNLMSPPDQVFDSFNHGVQSDKQSTVQDGLDKQPMPMSPPISPYNRTIQAASETITSSNVNQVQDPILYPSEGNVASSPAQSPLFAPAELEDHRHIVDDHIRARSSSPFAGIVPPKREDYELAISFRAQVMKHYTKNPRGWLAQELAFLKADRRAQSSQRQRQRQQQHSQQRQRYHTILPAAKPVASKTPRPRTDKVTKPQSAPRPIRTHPGPSPNAKSSAKSNANQNQIQGQMQNQNPNHSSNPNPGPMRPTTARRVSATPEPSRRIVAPNREDKDFKSLPDYCPPLSSLPARSNSLKVDWKGQPIDLSGDPFVSLLHPDEVMLAGNLRLDCATYLTSKRRIFERRLTCLRNGKEFRKTDAQQACKIDVNKASKLWTAFDKVAWLDADWVRQYL